MWYEINISLHGIHFFATNERSIQTKDKLFKVLEELEKHFTKDNGYKISVKKMECIGSFMSINYEGGKLIINEDQI